MIHHVNDGPPALSITFAVTVTPGLYTTPAQLAEQRESMRIVLNQVVQNDVHHHVFPEFDFGPVTVQETVPATPLPPACTVCGGPLEKSEQYPHAGWVHRNDADDTHVPATAGIDETEV